MLWLVMVSQLIGGSAPWRRHLLLAGIVVVAVMLGAGRASLQSEHRAPPDLAASTHAIGTVLTMTRNSATGGQVRVSVAEIGSWNDLHAVDSFGALVSLPTGADVTRGDRIRMAWSASPLAGISPGYASYVRAQGAVASAFATNVEVMEPGHRFFRVIEDLRDDISRGLMAVLPGDRGALAAGIVTGDDSGLSDAAADAFRASGTSHITAVSGTNVAMVVALWSIFMRSNRSRRLVVVQVSIVLTVWLYALLTGLEPPAARAATMASLMLLGSHVGRRPDPMTLLALTSAAMVLWNPRNVELVAFWLSVVATAAIISRMPSHGESGWWESILTIGQAVLLAQIATLPIILTTFATWSLVSILANTLVSPLMILAVPLSFALGTVVVIAPLVAPFVAWLPGLFLGAALHLVEDLARLLPPVTADADGSLLPLFVGVPCVLMLVVLSRDGHRWLFDLERAWHRQPRLIAVVAIAPALGVLGAVIARTI
jgi:ComEC/Rec2-related protein